MQNRKVSLRYAQSLLDVTEENNSLPVMYTDAKLVVSALDENPQLKKLLYSPVIKPNVKVSIFDEIFSGKINEDLHKFIRFIIEKNREEYLYDIFVRFLELRNEKLGIVDVEVKTAVQFNEKQTAELRQRLESIFNKKIEMNFVIDKDILGGFIAKVGDTLYDASIKNQLSNLKRMFLQGNTF
jgi:F-type H+-transporting ATPase subunit delta